MFLDYRITFMENRTPIDACSVYRLMEKPADFPRSFPRRVQTHLNRRDSLPCSSPTPLKDTLIDGIKYQIALEYVVSIQ